eukprot:TRINITY_DN6552_c0_g1_i1.p2 TRINITY_DN6552_c0_g1~~TRINITY_DN6552_c0_g1_i1.p2  ORF type:complete len:248 (-),score=54.10 TRINITY_DN6552_c0_g1_i1:52-795(-)
MSIEGVNNAASHASLMHGLRNVDISPQGVMASKVHMEETLSSLAASPLRSTSRSRLSATAASSVPPLAAASPTCRRVRVEFRRALMLKYRSIPVAWREMDPQQNGRIGFLDFCRACRHLGWNSESRLLWEALDTDEDGFITLEDVDPQLAALLKGFYAKLREKSIGRCPAGLFAKACEHMGYDGDAEAIYKALNVDSCSSGVSCDDITLLDSWFRGIDAGRWSYQSLRPTLPSRPQQFGGEGDETPC